MREVRSAFSASGGDSIFSDCKLDFLSTLAILALIWTSFPGCFLVLISFNVNLDALFFTKLGLRKTAYH